MHLPVTAEFYQDKERFAFRHTCESCAFFERANGSCRHSWPNASHRDAAYQQMPPQLSLCKEFELE